MQPGMQQAASAATMQKCTVKMVSCKGAMSSGQHWHNDCCPRWSLLRNRPDRGHIMLQQPNHTHIFCPGYLTQPTCPAIAAAAVSAATIGIARLITRYTWQHTHSLSTSTVQCCMHTLSLAVLQIKTPAHKSKQPLGMHLPKACLIKIGI